MNKKNTILTGIVQSLNHKGEGLVPMHINHTGQQNQSNNNNQDVQSEKIFIVKEVFPGEYIEIQKSTSRKKQLKKFAKKNKVLQSPWIKTSPICHVYHLCGGCNMQELSYEDQLQLKASHVRMLLEPLLKHHDIAKAEQSIVFGSERYYYRNRVDYTCGARRWLEGADHIEEDDFERQGLGFHVKGFYDKIVQLSHCYLHKSNAIRNAIYHYTKEHNITYFNSRNHTGWLRMITVRNTLDGAYMIIISVFSYDEQHIAGLCTMLRTKFPQITSIYSAINTQGTDSLQGTTLELEYGTEYIIERCGHIHLYIRPEVFYQTNSYMAAVLYQQIVDMAVLKKTDTVLDLYCGIGSIGLFIAKNVKCVLGIEEIEASVILANENARLNDIQNISFIVGTVEDSISKLDEQAEEADVIILDPPRTGMHPKVISYMLASKVKKILYVSCNPTTLARDITLLSSAYELIMWQAVDMFPHTHHVETIALLCLNNGE